MKLKVALVVLMVGLAFGITAHALGDSDEQSPAAVLDSLLQTGHRPVAYQATRRLEAASSKLNESAWLDVFTEYDEIGGFRYRVLGEGGSGRIRNRVLLPVLEAEKQSSALNEWRKAALNRDNYDFNLDGHTQDGMIKIQLNPRRRDVRLVEGAAWLSQSGELVRLQGRLSKSPSFWVRWVDVTRRYMPLRDAIVPIAVESVADVRFAGMSTFSMHYDYAMVNGQKVASPPQHIFAMGLLSPH